MTVKQRRVTLITMCVAIAIIMVTLFLSINANLNKVIEDITASDVYSDMYEETT